MTISCPSSFYLCNFIHNKIQHQSIPQQETGQMWRTAEQRLKRTFIQGNEKHNVRPILLRNKIWRKCEGKCFTKKVMKVSSHVQQHRIDSVLPRHSQQRFRLRTETGSFRNVYLFWILVAMENVLMSAGDISQRKTSLILAVFVLQCCSQKWLDVLPEMWCLVLYHEIWVFVSGEKNTSFVIDVSDQNCTSQWS